MVKLLRARVTGNPLAAALDLLLLALIAAGALWLVSDARQESTGRCAADAAMIAFYGWLLSMRLRGHRPSIRRQRRELLAAARKMADKDLWLNRDEHIGIACRRFLRIVSLMVFSEDDMRDIELLGTGPFIATSYIIMPASTDVIRRVSGLKVTRLPDGTPDIAGQERKSQWRKWREAWSESLDIRRGYLASDRGELEQVVRWLAGAERAGSLDESGGTP